MPRIKGNITTDNGSIHNSSNGSFLFEPHKGTILGNRHHLYTNVNMKVDLPFPSSSFYKCHGSKFFASVHELEENNDISFYSLNNGVVEEVGRYTLPISFDTYNLQCICADRFVIYYDKSNESLHYVDVITSECFDLGNLRTYYMGRNAPFFKMEDNTTVYIRFDALNNPQLEQIGDMKLKEVYYVMNSETYHVIELGNQHIHMFGIDEDGCFGKLATYPPLRLPKRLIQCCFQYEDKIFLQVSSPKFDSIAFSLHSGIDDFTVGIGTCLLRQIVGINGQMYNASNGCLAPIVIERSPSAMFGMVLSGMLQKRRVTLRMLPLLYNSNCIFSVDILNETPKNMLFMFNNMDAPELVHFRQSYSAKYGRVVTYHAEKHKDDSIYYYVDGECCKTSSDKYTAWSDDVFVRNNSRVLHVNDSIVCLQEYGIADVYDETVWVLMHHFIGFGTMCEGKFQFTTEEVPAMKLYINHFNPLMAITLNPDCIQLWWFDKESLVLLPITICSGENTITHKSLLRFVHFISEDVFIVRNVVYRFADGEVSVTRSIPAINGKEIGDFELFPSKPFLLSGINPSLDGLDIIKYEISFDELGTSTTELKRYSVLEALTNCEHGIFSSASIGTI
ncbi:hypothetical protein PCE1_003366 [Barthelona sp. PCE]